MAVTISSLELENVKRIKAVTLEPSPSGLTIIGGKNAQGKTSVIDAIAWALGGERFRPNSPTRKGSATPAKLKLELSNGLIVTRSGERGTLKVTDPTGKRQGQNLLNSFIEQLALNLPKFMNYTDREKAEVLLDLIGVKDELIALDRKIEELSNTRQPLRTEYLGKFKVVEEMPYHPDAPEEPLSAADLIQEQQSIMAANSEHERERQELAASENEFKSLESKMALKSEEIAALEQRINEVTHERDQIQKERNELLGRLQILRDHAATLKNRSTDEIEQKIRNIEQINQRVAENKKRADLEMEAETVKETYQELSRQIEEAREKRLEILKATKMPLDDLMVDGGELIYRGATWSDMSGAEQLKVATAIIRKLNPKCGFVLVDKLEQMDTDTLTEFGEWACAQGLQVIGTRVSTGDECSVVIEDGYVKGDSADTVTPTLEAGKF